MAQITEDFISFETAKLLKEKGFDEETPVNYFVGDDKQRGYVVGEMIHHKRVEEDTHLIACPTLWMAMKWLREVHKIFIDVDFDTIEFGDKPYFTIITNMSTCSYITGRPALGYKTYEEACEAAILYTIKNLI